MPDVRKANFIRLQPRSLSLRRTSGAYLAQPLSRPRFQEEKAKAPQKTLKNRIIGWSRKLIFQKTLRSAKKEHKHNQNTINTSAKKDSQNDYLKNHAQYKVAKMYSQGIGTKQDTEKSIIWYEQAMTYGHSKADYQLALLLREDGPKKDKDRSDHLLARASEGGNTKAWVILSMTAEEMKASAERGDPEAQFRLGKMFFHGRGTCVKNVDLAHMWFKRAAQKGHAIAQNNLGLMYIMGLGVDKEPARGRFWLGKSIEGGYPAAKSNLRSLEKQHPHFRAS